MITDRIKKYIFNKSLQKNVIFNFTIVVFLILFPVFYAYSQEKPALGINLENYEYPFPVNYIDLNSQGKTLKMAYMYEKTEKPVKKTVLLLHGKNFCGAYWEQTVNALKQLGYNVLVPDQIGFCKSSKPGSYQYTFHQLAYNTKKLTDSLNVNNITVIGHSMGGMLATRFALMYPQTVSKLVLVNPIGLEDWKLVVPYQTIDDWYKSELNKSYEVVKRYMKENYYDGKWDEKYDEWVYLLTGMKDSPDYDRYARTSAQIYDMIFTQPVLYEFDDLEVPTVLIIGLRDRTALGKNLVDKRTRKTMGNYPELGKKVCWTIHDCRLIQLDDTGHLPHIENFPLFMTNLEKALGD